MNFMWAPGWGAEIKLAPNVNAPDVSRAPFKSSPARAPIPGRPLDGIESNTYKEDRNPPEVAAGGARVWAAACADYAPSRPAHSFGWQASVRLHLLVRRRTGKTLIAHPGDLASQRSDTTLQWR